MSEQDGLSKRLSEQQRARLKGLLSKKRKEQIKRRGSAYEQVAPLSFAQQRLWFIDQLIPDEPLYHVPIFLRLKGELNVAAMERAVDEIVRRHEVLRTVFVSVDGTPMQQVQPHRPISLPCAKVREEELLAVMEAELKRPFDLANGPVCRARLLQVAADDAVLMLTVHHIATDGWSNDLLTRELSELYNAYAAGEPSPLPELPVQYADYACWQREWLTGQVLERQLAYWQERLKGAPSVLELPTDRVRPAKQSYRGALAMISLSANLMEEVRQVGREDDATLFMMLMAACQVLLHRYSGQSDFCIGTPVAGRNRTETERLIGFFVNTLVLRSDLQDDLPFRELVRRVRRSLLDAFDHQDLPFEQVVEALQPDRNLSLTPLFQVMFTMANAPASGMELAGLHVRPMEAGAGASHFDLTFNILEEADGTATVKLFYNADLWEPATMQRMLRHFERLLQSISSAKECPVSQLPLLTEEERHQMLVEWNDTETAVSERCVHELFAEQAARTPDAVALVFEGREVSYRELNRRANQLAHHLRKRGVGPEVLVGIAAERSVEMVVGMLGILKAGGAYVPLDPSYPEERLMHMLADSRVSVLLTQQHLEGRLPEHRAKVIRLDADWDAWIAAEPEEDVQSGVTPDHLVYVIYTSGSTGKPKGTMVPHRGVVNRLVWGQRQYQLTGQDRVMQKTPFSFDVSVWEFFWPLISGARLVLARPEGHRDSQYLIELIREQGITTMHFVPSMLQVFVEEPELSACTSLRQVFCSGEALSVGTQRKFFQRLRGVNLHNLYGPTETSIEVSQWACRPDCERGTVPIGRAIANTKLYVLDAHGQPVPVGVPGELHIGGVQVARGYLNLPDLTAEKFVDDPFAAKKGQRMYRTGDLVRFLPDGNIEFLGRIDHQVKIRGYRIELGEIEAALIQHERVSEAIVTAAEGRLAAYVVPEKAAEIDAAELREFLKKNLPDFMLPGAFVVLEAMPLSPNGKADRKALPAPQWSAGTEVVASLEPRTDTERALAEIWSEVLGAERVGVQDNFFLLGGHSLLATHLIAKIQSVFQVRLPLRTLFSAPTVEEMARAVEQSLRDAAKEAGEHRPRSSLVPLSAGKPLFLVHPLGGGLFAYSDLVQEIGSECAVYGFEAPGFDGEDDPLTAVHALAARYVREMRRLQPEGPYRLGGMSMGGIVVYEMAQQLQAQGAAVELLVLFDSYPTLPGTVIRDDEVVMFMAEDLVMASGQAFPALDGRFRSWSTEEQIRHVWEVARTHDLIPKELELAELHRRFRVFKAHSVAMATYVVKPCAEGLPILLLRALDYPATDRPDDLNWGELSGTAPRVEWVPGTHYSMLKQPHASAVADHLRRWLHEEGKGS